MSRYYYKDPLAAAWMAKHFGMAYETERFYVEADYGNPNKFPGLSLDERGDLTKYDKIYIHPDSVHLLEPQEGDIIGWPAQASDGTPITLSQVYWKWQGVPDNFEIIQRNGIAFMWPEVEND